MSGFDNAIDAGDASTDSGFDLHELIEIDDSTDDDVVECHPRPVAPPEDDEERSVAETCNSIEAKGHDKEADEVADEGEVADDDEHDTKSKDRVEMAQQPCVDVVASSDESKPEDEQDTKDEVSKVAEPVAVAKKSPKSPKKKKDIASEEEKKPNNTARCGNRGRGRGRGSPRGGRGGSTKDARHSSSSSPSQTEDVSTTAPDTTDSQKSPTRGLGAAKTRATRSPRGKSSPSATILAPATPPSSVSSLSAFGDTFTPPHTPDSSNSSLGSVSTEEYFSAKTPPSPPTPLPLTPPKTPKRKRKVSATSANVEVVIESSPGTEGESPAKKKRVYKPRVKKVPAVAEADTKAAAATPAGAIPAAVVSTVPVHVEDAPAISEAEEDPDIEASQPSEASQSQPSLGSPTKVTKKAKSNKPKVRDISFLVEDARDTHSRRQLCLIRTRIFLFAWNRVIGQPRR